MEEKKQRAGLGNTQGNNDNIGKALVAIGGAFLLVAFLYFFFSGSEKPSPQPEQVEIERQEIVYQESPIVTTPTMQKMASMDHEDMIAEVRWSSVIIAAFAVTNSLLLIYVYLYFTKIIKPIHNPIKLDVGSITVCFIALASVRYVALFLELWTQQEGTEYAYSDLFAAYGNLFANKIKTEFAVIFGLAALINGEVYTAFGFCKLMNNKCLLSNGSRVVILLYIVSFVGLFVLSMGAVYLFSLTNLLKAPNCFIRLVEREEEAPAADEGEGEQESHNQEEDAPDSGDENEEDTYSIPEEPHTSDEEGAEEEEDSYGSGSQDEGDIEENEPLANDSDDDSTEEQDSYGSDSQDEDDIEENEPLANDSDDDGSEETYPELEEEEADTTDEPEDAQEPQEEEEVDAPDNEEATVEEDSPEPEEDE